MAAVTRLTLLATADEVIE